MINWDLFLGLENGNELRNGSCCKGSGIILLTHLTAVTYGEEYKKGRG